MIFLASILISCKPPSYTYSTLKVSGFTNAVTMSSSQCIALRVASFVDAISALQPWEGGYAWVEQPLLVEIQRSATEIADDYYKLISLYSTKSRDEIDEITVYSSSPSSSSSSLLVEKVRRPILPRWITDMSTMQTPIIRKEIS